MTRIKLITEKSDVAPEQAEEFDAITEVLGGVRGPFSVLMHSPGLAQKVMEAGAQVRLGSTLSGAERELAIIATARERDAAYEWSSHVRAARHAGVSDSTIVEVRDRGDLAGLDSNERDIVTFVRQLLRSNRVEQPLFDTLVARHSVRWLVELTATVGQYQYIGVINNTFGVGRGPEDPDPLPV